MQQRLHFGGFKTEEEGKLFPLKRTLLLLLYLTRVELHPLLFLLPPSHSWIVSFFPEKKEGMFLVLISCVFLAVMQHRKLCRAKSNRTHLETVSIREGTSYSLQYCLLDQGRTSEDEKEKFLHFIKVLNRAFGCLPD